MSAVECQLCDTWNRAISRAERDAHFAALDALADRAACAESFAFQIADPDSDRVTQNAVWNAARRAWEIQYKVASPHFQATPVTMAEGTADCTKAVAIRERIRAAESLVVSEGDGLALAETRNEREAAGNAVLPKAASWLAWRRGQAAPKA